MKLKVIETTGRELGSVLVNLNLTGCWWDDCFLCECEARGRAKGGSHTRAGYTRGRDTHEGGGDLHRHLPRVQGDGYKGCV